MHSNQVAPLEARPPVVKDQSELINTMAHANTSQHPTLHHSEFWEGFPVCKHSIKPKAPLPICTTHLKADKTVIIEICKGLTGEIQAACGIREKPLTCKLLEQHLSFSQLEDITNMSKLLDLYCTFQNNPVCWSPAHRRKFT